MFVFLSPPSHQDSLWERILASIVVVAAVVGDLFSNLRANTAQHYQGTCQAAQLKLAALCHPVGFPSWTL